MSSKINIAIVYPNKSSSSETFIQAHLNGLPAVVHGLYGGRFPVYTPKGLLVPLPPPPSILLRLFNKIKNKFWTVPKESPGNKALLKYFEDNKIKAVMAEYGLTGVAIMNICKRAKIPLIVHFHGFDAYHFNIIEQNKANYSQLFIAASAIIAVSNDMKKQLVKLGADEKKVHVNSCGVDITQFKLRQIKPSGFTFLFAGRFVNKKAPHLVILAFHKICHKIPEAKLMMMGDGGLGSKGELFEGCKQLAKALGIYDKIIFKGVYQPEELINIMPQAFCLIQHSVRPSSGDSEGTPVTLLEACSVGLPVIATKHGGITDVVIHEKTGFLVDEYDIDSTAEYMLKLAMHPDVAFNMGIEGRKRIEQLYSMDTSLNNLWSIIQNSITND